MDLSNISIWTIIFISLGIGLLTSFFAKSKGKNALLWFVLGFFFGIIAPIILAFLPSNKKSRHCEAPETNGSVKPMHSEAAYPSPEEPIRENTPRPQRLPLDRNLKWFYINTKLEQKGPVSLHELRKVAAEGQINDESYIWCDEFDDWKKVRDLSNGSTIFDQDFLE